MKEQGKSNMHIIFESLLMQLSELVCARRKIQLAKAGAFSFETQYK